MRTHRLTLAAVGLLLLATGCGTDDGEPEEGASGAAGSGGVEAGFPCTAVSDEVLDAVEAGLRDAGYSSPAGRLGVGLLDGSEHVVGCTIVPDFLYAGVLGFDRQVPLAEHLEAYGETPPEPVAGLGDEALAAANSYGGTRLVARRGDRVVLVDSRLPEDTMARDVLQDLAEALLAAEDDVPPTDLPAGCPAPDDEHVVGELDQVVLARGQAGPEGVGGVRCDYASDDAFLVLQAVTPGEGVTTMLRAGQSEAPVDLDGDEAYVDDDTVSLLVGESCLISVRTSPMGWAPAEPRSDEETAAALLDLARWVRDDIGCPD